MHGNHAALTTVLEAFKLRKVTQLFCLGDLVGYYHQVPAVIETMMELNPTTLMGNHEAYLLGTLPLSKEKWEFINLEYVKNTLTEKQRAWLAARPLSFEETIGGKKILGFHGSPWNLLEEYIYPDFKSFEKFAAISADYILLGHTHYPFLKNVGRTTIINPGSCGQPRAGGYKASAAILDTDTGDVEFLKIDYNVKQFIREAETAGVPEKVIGVLKRP